MNFPIVLLKQCNGGQSLERSLSLYIVQKGYNADSSSPFISVKCVVIGFVIVCDRDLARWRCFRTECNWADRVRQYDYVIMFYIYQSFQELGSHDIGDKLLKLTYQCSRCF